MLASLTIIKPNPMPSQKETLIHQLRDVQLSCLARLKTFQNNQLINDQAATDAKQQIEDLEVDLHSALLWADELAYDEHQLLQAIVALKLAPEETPDTFLDHFSNLQQLIRDMILTPLQERAAQAAPSQWNQKMLDELLKIRRALRETKNTLIAGNQDPTADPEFLELESAFTAFLAVYRKHLRENTVQADEDAIKTMELMTGLIKAATDVPKFKASYQLLNDYVESQIPVTEEEDA